MLRARSGAWKRIVTGLPSRVGKSSGPASRLGAIAVTRTTGGLVSFTKDFWITTLRPSRRSVMRVRYVPSAAERPSSVVPSHFRNRPV